MPPPGSCRPSSVISPLAVSRGREPAKVSKLTLADLMPGLYHVQLAPVQASGVQVSSEATRRLAGDQEPEGTLENGSERSGFELAARLGNEIRAQGRSCLLLPWRITDFLVADTVVEEIAFDLENWGYTGARLETVVAGRLRESLFSRRGEQALEQLSGGEQQILAATVALDQPHDFFIGQNCFDFVSRDFLLEIAGQARRRGKRFLELTHRPVDQAWQYVEGGIEELSQNLDWPEDKRHSAVRWPRVSPLDLVIENLEKSYTDSAFRLSVPWLEVSGVRCLGIHGANGSGKSTLADCLAGLTEFAGKVDITIGGAAIERVGALLQQATTPTYGLSAAEVIGRFVRFGKLTAEAGQQLLQILAEDGSYRSLAQFDALTGHRLVVSAALLAGSDDLVILDEPTYGLPSPAVLDFLAEIAAAFGGKPLVLISHDRKFLSCICEEIITLHEGELVDRYYSENSHDKPIP